MTAIPTPVARCAACFQTKDRVKHLITGPGPGLYICNHCVERCNRAITWSIPGSPQDSKQCAFCKNSEEPSYFGIFGELLICNHCMDFCNEILTETVKSYCDLPSQIALAKKCSFCSAPDAAEEQLVEGVRGLICRKCSSRYAAEFKASDSNPRNASVCDFCKEEKDVLSGSEVCRICEECISLSQHVHWGQQIGPEFIWFAACQRAQSNESIDDFAAAEDTATKCNFCSTLQPSSSELFPGSASRVCDPCYKQFREHTD
ncbi:MAG: ClpX C4-type zinc finger protein [Terriglobales bacterium]